MNRVAGFTVALKTDLHRDDAEKVAEAIRLLNGVAGVEIQTADIASHIASMRVRQQIAERIYAVIYAKEEP